MSVKISAMVFEGGPRLLAQHSVMIALADNADDFGVAWPGLELLADKSRMSVRNVIRVLEALEREGWLIRRSRARGEHRRGSVYELNLARLSARAAAPQPAEPRNVPRATKRSTPLHGAETRCAREEEETAEIAGNLSRRDTVSPHAADEAADAAGYAPRHDNLSSAAPGVQKESVTCQPEHRDMTTSTPRHDTALADLLLAERDAKQNRHRTTIEPSIPPKPPQGGHGMERGALRGERQEHGDVALTEEELEELAEVNAMRARMTPPEPPWSWEAWAQLQAQMQRIANPVDPIPFRSRRRRRVR